MLSILLVVAFATGLWLRPWMDWVLESDTFALIHATVLHSVRRQRDGKKSVPQVAVAQSA